MGAKLKKWEMNKTNLISVRELRLEMPRYINEIARGKTYIVLKRSKPVFKISPVLSRFEQGSSSGY